MTERMELSGDLVEVGTGPHPLLEGEPVGARRRQDDLLPGGFPEQDHARIDSEPQARSLGAALYPLVLDPGQLEDQALVAFDEKWRAGHRCGSVG